MKTGGIGPKKMIQSLWPIILVCGGLSIWLGRFDWPTGVIFALPTAGCLLLAWDRHMGLATMLLTPFWLGLYLHFALPGYGTFLGLICIIGGIGWFKEVDWTSS